MSSESGRRLYIGNLPDDIVEDDLIEEFEIFGRIRRCTLKSNNRPGTNPFAFVEYDSSRSADGAVQERDRTMWRGCRLRVEIPFNERNSSVRSRGRGYAPRRGEFVIEVRNLPPSGSWQDLKDHFREVGDIVHTDVFKHGNGEVSFNRRSDMDRALRHMDGSTFKSHDGETSRISVYRGRSSRGYSPSRRRPMVMRRGGRHDRYRSRSPRSMSPRGRRNRSPYYTRTRSRSASQPYPRSPRARSMRSFSPKSRHSRSISSRSPRSRSPGSRSKSTRLRGPPVRSRSVCSRSKSPRSRSRALQSPRSQRSKSPVPQSYQSQLPESRGHCSRSPMPRTPSSRSVESERSADRRCVSSQSRSSKTCNADSYNTVRGEINGECESNHKNSDDTATCENSFSLKNSQENYEKNDCNQEISSETSTSKNNCD